MDIQSYLRRINYQGPLRPSIDVLRRLHRQHLLTVPFENLDIHRGRPIVLDEQAFYDKIIHARRGGYCYELNGCFAWLLKSLGFKVSMVSARVARKSGEFSPEFDHMTLLVRLRERWLADVGFGDLFSEPLRLSMPDPQQDDGGQYWITKKKVAWLLSRWDEKTSSWQSQYAFGLRPRKLANFTARNRYQQTSPNSHFTQNRLISKLTPTGRVTLTDTEFVVTDGRKRVEHKITSSREFDKLLVDVFKVKLE